MKILSAILVGYISLALNASLSANIEHADSKYKISNNALQSLLMGLKSDNEGVVKSSIILAGNYKIMEAVEALTEIIDSELSFEIKTAAVYSLYQIQNDEALRTLKSIAINHKCPYLRQSSEVFLYEYIFNHPK